MYFIDDLTDAAMNNPQADTADLVMKLEGYRQLYTAVNKLPEAQRRRLLLHFVDNLTYRQIAELEGVNPVAVSHSIKRALIQLKKCLTD
jgi:RNA polymerase sigma factor (sigma-70 family)